MPTPRFAPQVQRLEPMAVSPESGGDTITEEPVIVSGNGYTVRGFPVATRTNLALNDGDVVHVLWKNGTPFMILDAQGRHGPGTDEPFGGGPVVEDLFIARRPDDGVNDLWFRNFDQCRPLKLDVLGVVAADIGTVKWGPSQDRFIVQAGAKLHAFKFDRKPHAPFRKGQNAAKLLALTSTATPSASTTVLAVASMANQVPSSISFSLASPLHTFGFTHSPGLASGNVGQEDFHLDDAGNIIVQVQFGIAGGQPSIPDPAGGPTPVLLEPNFDWRHVILLDVTRNKIVFTTWDSGAAQFSPIQAGLPWNSLDANNYPAVVTSPGGTTFCISSTVPADIGQRYFVAPLLITEKDGLVAWVGYEQRTTQVIQEGGSPGDCSVATTPRTGAFVQPLPKGTVVQAPIVIFPLTTGVLGLCFAYTYNRLVLSTPGTNTFVPFDIAQSTSVPGFSLLFSTGAQTQLTADLRNVLGRHGVNVVPTDFAYQLDNPINALATGAKVNYFVRLWQFKGAVTANVDAGSYPEDTQLAPAKSLAKVPTGVTHPKFLGAYALQVVNQRSSLPGHFQASP